MVFANIEYLFLLLLLIPYIVWYILKQKKSEATLQISDARVYAHTPKSYKNYLLHVPFLLRCLALVLVILVLARPPVCRELPLRVYPDERFLTGTAICPTLPHTPFHPFHEPSVRLC